MSTTQTTQPSSKAADISAFISVGTDVATTAISLIAGMNDAKKRQQFSNNLTLLSEEAKAQLQQRLLDANSEAERMRILSQYLTDASKTRIDNLTLSYQLEEKRKRTTLLMTGAIILAVVGIAGFIVYKRT